MTAPDTPYSYQPPELSPEAQAVSDQIRDAVKRQMEARAAAIERACRVAVRVGFGVRVKTYQDGRTTVAVDPTVPEWTIYEEHPDQPTYGMSFED